MDSIRQQLDELMGVDRNIPLAERKKKKEHYDDPEVCKFQLVSICPHDLFPNTKCDLGACTKRHDDMYKKMFLEDEGRTANEKKYINETINLFESLLHGVDGKIKKAQTKLDQAYATTDQPKELQEKLDAIDEEIVRLLQQVEALGDEGKIDESEACMAQIESLKKRKEEMKLTGDPNLGSSNRQMKVCEICGAMQALNDTEKRSQAHYEGKLHTGFAILRRELEQLRKRREELRNMALFNRKEKEKEHEKGEGKEKDGEHSPERHQGKRKRSKSRSRSRSRSYRRDRDRGDRRRRSGSRSRRSRSRDRKYKSHHTKDRRDRDRDRSRSDSRRNKKSHRRDRSRDRREGRNEENGNAHAELPI